MESSLRLLRANLLDAGPGVRRRDHHQRAGVLQVPPLQGRGAHCPRVSHGHSRSLAPGSSRLAKRGVCTRGSVRSEVGCDETRFAALDGRVKTRLKCGCTLCTPPPLDTVGCWMVDERGFDRDR